MGHRFVQRMQHPLLVSSARDRMRLHMHACEVGLCLALAVLLLRGCAIICMMIMITSSFVLHQLLHKAMAPSEQTRRSLHRIQVMRAQLEAERMHWYEPPRSR